MASVESLAALCAGAINHNRTPARSSSTERLSKSEIAGLLSGLSPDEMMMAQAKYMDDDDAKIDLICAVRRYTHLMARSQSWKIEGNKINALADIATGEALSPNRCKRCNGIGHKLNKACMPCNGTGFKATSIRKMASVVGINESTFRASWMEKLSMILNYVYDLDGAVNRRVSMNSRD
jgi:hypothetical protein